MQVSIWVLLGFCGGWMVLGLDRVLVNGCWGSTDAL